MGAVCSPLEPLRFKQLILCHYHVAMTRYLRKATWPWINNKPKWAKHKRSH